MPRAGLTTERVVRAAGEMADEHGWSQLTLAGLASRLGVRQPSLYKHIDSLDGLHRGISVLAKRELGEVISRAAVGRSGREALASVCLAYRAWVHAHPGRYAATVRAPAPGDLEDQQAAADVVAVVVAVLAGFGLEGERAIDAARTVRSAVHGFVALEASGGFGLPRDLDASFAFLIDTLTGGLDA
ncbi:MAG: WHG domain-containing protein [Dermatophilaceae bacterium]